MSALVPYKLSLLTTLPVLVLEGVSYSLRVVSLSVRLFANVTSGHLLLHVLAGILWFLVGSCLIISSLIV